MLRFQEAPDEISLAILHAALTDALDWIDDNQDARRGHGGTYLVPALEQLFQ